MMAMVCIDLLMVMSTKETSKTAKGMAMVCFDMLMVESKTDFGKTVLFRDKLLSDLKKAIINAMSWQMKMNEQRHKLHVHKLTLIYNSLLWMPRFHLNRKRLRVKPRLTKITLTSMMIKLSIV